MLEWYCPVYQFCASPTVLSINDLLGQFKLVYKTVPQVFIYALNAIEMYVWLKINVKVANEEMAENWTDTINHFTFSAECIQHRKESWREKMAVCLQ